VTIILLLGATKDKDGSWMIFERQQGAQTGLTDKVQLLHKTTLSRMEEVARYIDGRITVIRLLAPDVIVFNGEQSQHSRRAVALWIPNLSELHGPWPA